MVSTDFLLKASRFASSTSTTRFGRRRFGEGPSLFGFFALFAGETSCDTRATRSGEAGARRGRGSMDTSTAKPSKAVGPRARANKLGDGAGAHFATSILFVTAFLSLSSFGQAVAG